MTIKIIIINSVIVLNLFFFFTNSDDSKSDKGNRKWLQYKGCVKVCSVECEESPSNIKTHRFVHSYSIFIYFNKTNELTVFFLTVIIIKQQQQKSVKEVKV